MAPNIETLTKQRSIEIAQEAGRAGNSGYSFAESSGQIRMIEQIKKMASCVRDIYWRAMEYGAGKLDSFGLVNANFDALKAWADVSRLFNYLNNNYRAEASGVYQTFRKYSAALMGFFSQKAYMETA